MAPLFSVRNGELLAVFVTPLFFGVAHLHHLHDLIRYQSFPATQASMMVRATHLLMLTSEDLECVTSLERQRHCSVLIPLQLCKGVDAGTQMDTRLGCSA